MCAIETGALEKGARFLTAMVGGYLRGSSLPESEHGVRVTCWIGVLFEPAPAALDHSRATGRWLRNYRLQCFGQRIAILSRVKEPSFAGTHDLRWSSGFLVNDRHHAGAPRVEHYSAESFCMRWADQRGALLQDRPN